MTSDGRLAGRRVVLGVSGGVAAYKSAVLARLLLSEGAEVRAVMTRAATDFLGPATLAALTGHPVVTSLVGHEGSVSPHTDLGRWAEVVVVAPATTATISRIAVGLSEDALSATVLATRAPLAVAPAMHTEMWEHPATQRAIATLTGDGVTIIGPESGALAGGDEGPGRMSEPETVLEAVVAMLAGGLGGTSILITAGGTREAIDPVRYIGNRSSGKMGHAIAEEAARRGAAVTLVTSSHLPSPGAVRRVQVESAQEMADAVASVDPDVAIMAAAVADFRPSTNHDAKLSRADGPPEIVLEPTPDILKTVADRVRRPFLVGFAAETGSLERAVEKARRKGVDVLVANDVSQPDAGFAVDTNRVTICWPDGRTEPWELAQKSVVAARILDLIERELGRTR
ncbi:MAG: bifunctional phosphopantothenoylcysteine decarboxylase/phosphopantothenate--cysteine ligase CoaBC [Acidimicrobiia bacterium]|nr:bifunctional phosphopantothenoylcysteine decarboxylase/phosphopantothenate--cysteine ligase CoaBC [Acidimicrobiia bacterium]MDH5294239.1 bifunctional phosphopantothenoylcysteine decarboxylase/phosphopantothenate--cysteine ligase CoaBC [Acidimicrobiia bacterium]